MKSGGGSQLDVEMVQHHRQFSSRIRFERKASRRCENSNGELLKPKSETEADICNSGSAISLPL